MLPARVEAALGDFRSCLAARFGDRIRELRLFGSYSRGEQGAESDVDLLVVVDDLARTERREVFDLAEDVFFDTLVHLSPLALSDAEFATLRAREYLLVDEIDRDGIPL